MRGWGETSKSIKWSAFSQVFCILVLVSSIFYIPFFLFRRSEESQVERNLKQVTSLYLIEDDGSSYVSVYQR